MLANKFATMRFGKIVAVTEAMPPLTFGKSVEITDAEFDLLRSVRSPDSSMNSTIHSYPCRRGWKIRECVL